jgi:Prokaryotic membrane lipoprotein lipid attachment site
MRRNLLLIGALALLAGCSGGSVSPRAIEQTAAQLRAVPLSLGMSGATLTAQTAVWRDLMPTVGPATPKGVIASITVQTESTTALPSGLTAERVTLVNGEEVWTTTEIEKTTEASLLRLVVRSGPAWEVGSSTDVVVDLRDSAGVKQQIRAVGQIVSGAY